MLLWIVGYIGNSLCLLELGRYIADIDISVSVSYRHFRYRFFRYIDIVSMTSEISVIFRFFIRLLFRLFNVNYMIKVEYFIWQCDTSVTNGRLRLFGHIARSSPRKDHHRALAACIRQVPPNWKRPAGRPSHTWLRAIEADLGPLHLWPRDCLEKGHYSRRMATYCGHSNAPAVYALKEERNVIRRYTSLHLY